MTPVHTFREGQEGAAWGRGDPFFGYGLEWAPRAGQQLGR
jgi:hypothetical protein